MRRKYTSKSRYYAGSLRSKYARQEERTQAKRERATYYGNLDNQSYYRTDAWKRLHRQVIERDQGLCQYCGAPGNQADHIVPRSKGGQDALENLVCACQGCNKKAGARLFLSFDHKRNWLRKVRKITPVVEQPPSRLRDRLRAKRASELIPDGGM